MVAVPSQAEFHPEDIMPPPMRDGPWRIASIALDVSGRCNLSCRYCAEASTQPRRRPMTAATLDAAWRFLFPDGRITPNSTIRFGSGEPLLNFPLLQRLSSRIRKEGGNEAEGRPAVFLTTNGMRVNDEIRDWLIASGWHVKLSLDGPEPIHDQWRLDRSGGPTFDRVARVARDLAAAMPDRFSATAVLCRGADPQQVFEGITALGVQRIEMVPVAHRDRAILPTRGDVERYRRFVDGYATRWVEAARTEGIPLLLRFAGFVQKLMGYGVARTQCGAGRSYVSVAPTGDLYPCFRLIGVKRYRIGRLSTAIDSEAADRFRRGPGRPYEERASCRSCWAAALCGGPCFACAEMFGPGNGRPIRLHCAYNRADARAAAWMVGRLRSRDPERMLSFLPSWTAR